MTMLVQRLANPRDVTVPEDREDAAEQRLGAASVFAPDTSACAVVSRSVPDVGAGDVAAES
jgi:hypothetical protein